MGPIVHVISSRLTAAILKGLPEAHPTLQRVAEDKRQWNLIRDAVAKRIKDRAGEPDGEFDHAWEERICRYVDSYAVQDATDIHQFLLHRWFDRTFSLCKMNFVSLDQLQLFR